MLNNKHNTFIKRVFLIVWIITLCIGVSSCSDEPDGGKEVRILIEANTDSPIRVYGVGVSSQNGLVIRRNFENTFFTDKYSLSTEARCDDPTTLITISVWVNNKFKKKVFGNSLVTTGDYLK